MHEVVFLPAQRRVRVPEGTTLLEAARSAGLPVASACGQRGLCGRCGMQLVAGAGSVGMADDREERVKRSNRVAADQRLACRVVVSADLAARALYW